MKNRTMFIASVVSVGLRGVFLTSILPPDKTLFCAWFAVLIAELKLRFYISLNTSTGLNLLFIVEVPPLGKWRPGRPAPPRAQCCHWPVICRIRIGVCSCGCLMYWLPCFVQLSLSCWLPCFVQLGLSAVLSAMHCVVCCCLLSCTFFLSSTQWAVIQRTI